MAVAGDIRGEYIQTAHRPINEMEAALGVVGASARMLAPAAAPFAILGGLSLMSGVLRGGLAALGAGARAGMSALPTLQRSWDWARANPKRSIPIAAGALLAPSILSAAGSIFSSLDQSGKGPVPSSPASLHPSAALTYGTGAAAFGVGAAGFFVPGVAGKALAFGGIGLGTTIVAAGAGLRGANRQIAESRHSQNPFVHSANGYMARGAAGRNRTQGH